MNKTLIKWTLIVLLAAFTIMAVTGLSFVFGIHIDFFGELHKITGVIFICTILVHIITFRKILCNFICGNKPKK